MKISVLAEVGATTKSTTRVEEGTKLVDSSALNLQRWRILFALLLLAGQAAKAQRSERWTVETVRIERAGADGVHNLRCSSDGTYLLAGHTTSLEGDRDMAIFRLDRELRLDPSFGSSGVFTLGGSGDDQFADVCEWRDASGRLQGYYA